MGQTVSVSIHSLTNSRTWPQAQPIYHIIVHVPLTEHVRHLEPQEPSSMFNPIGSKAVVCAFAHRPDLILTGHESGKISLFDAKTGDEVALNEHAHRDTVTDLQLSPDRTYFVTSSKDKTARVRLTYFVDYYHHSS